MTKRAILKQLKEFAEKYGEYYDKNVSDEELNEIYQDLIIELPKFENLKNNLGRYFKKKSDKLLKDEERLYNCEFCNINKVTKKTVNPWEEDVNNKIIYQYICNKCFQDLIRDN